MMRLKLTGNISSWNDEKGFGFITPQAGGKSVFVHISAFTEYHRRPEQNQKVTYLLSCDKQRRPCADQVAFTNGSSFSTKKMVACMGATFSFGLIGVSVFIGKIPILILGLYGVASVVTFFVYQADKVAAQKGRWRTPEQTLHLLALAGGWPGALIAQQVLRHKSKKQPFRFIFWMTIALNVGALGWLHTPGATEKFLSTLARIFNSIMT